MWVIRFRLKPYEVVVISFRALGVGLTTFQV